MKKKMSILADPNFTTKKMNIQVAAQRLDENNVATRDCINLLRSRKKK
jgi:hypothetical protein